MDLDISFIPKVDACNMSALENELLQLQKENDKSSEENKQLKLQKSELKELLKHYNENTKLLFLTESIISEEGGVFYSPPPLLFL